MVKCDVCVCKYRSNCKCDKCWWSGVMSVCVSIGVTVNVISMQGVNVTSVYK